MQFSKKTRNCENNIDVVVMMRKNMKLEMADPGQHTLLHWKPHKKLVRLYNARLLSSSLAIAVRREMHAYQERKYYYVLT